MQRLVFAVGREAPLCGCAVVGLGSRRRPCLVLQEGAEQLSDLLAIGHAVQVCSVRLMASGLSPVFIKKGSQSSLKCNFYHYFRGSVVTMQAAVQVPLRSSVLSCFTRAVRSRWLQSPPETPLRRNVPTVPEACSGFPVALGGLMLRT